MFARTAVIVLVGLLIYSNSLSSPFLFDDQNSIVANPQIRALWPLSIPLSPPRDTPVAGRPVVNLSFAANYAVGRLDPWGYHVTNVVIHVMVGLVLFGIVRRTLKVRSVRLQADGSGPAKAGHHVSETQDGSANVALACALVWLVHPLNTEAVNYFSQRTELLMALFYLVTLYCSLRNWRSRAIAACALGMACKESMVTAPLVVMLYDRIFVFDSWKRMWRARRGLYLGLMSTWLVLAALMSSTPRTSVGFGAGTDSMVYLWNQFQMITRYLWLTIWPRDLVLDYGLPRALSFSDVLPQAALVAVLAIATVIALVRWPVVGFLGAWFFITLAPTSSFVPIATEVGAERRMYLPLMGLVVFAVCGIFFVLAGRKGLPRIKQGSPLDEGRAFTARQDIKQANDHFPQLDVNRAFTARQTIQMAVVIVICLLLAAGTIARNREYGTSLSLAHTIVDRWPSGRGHFLLGTELLTAGQREAAMKELELSAVDYPGARYALGTEMLAEGRTDAAIAQLETFIRALPTHANVAPARDMLGRAFASQGRFDLATEEFERLLRDFPAYPARADARRLLDQVRNARFPRS